MSKSAGQWVGTIAGGVIGSFFGMTALGASIGGMVGGIIDPPKGPSVTGPRLEDQGFTSSTLGAALARGYGTFPVSGNVIWLEGDKYREVTTTESQGGKGGGGSEVPSYTYYATFAVSLLRVTDPTQTVSLRRLWIGSNLVFDAGSGNIESTLASNNGQGVKFTFYPGSDDQSPNPRWQADKGVNAVSGLPGRCYIVIEDLDLTKYGNSLAMAQIKAEVVVGGTETPTLVAVDTLNGQYGTGRTLSGVQLSAGRVRYDAMTYLNDTQYPVAGQFYQSEFMAGETSSESSAIGGVGYVSSPHRLVCVQTDVPVVITQEGFGPPYSNIIRWDYGGSLVESDQNSESIIPYKPWALIVDNGDTFFAYADGATKIYKFSGVYPGAVSAAAHDVKFMGVSESYLFAVSFSVSSGSTTVWKFDRLTLTLIDTYTDAAADRREAAIYVASDTVFYTLSMSGAVFKWVDGVVVESFGTVFPSRAASVYGGVYPQCWFYVGNDDPLYMLAVYGPQSAGLHSLDVMMVHVIIAATQAKLRDIVTAECGLAGISSSDLDLSSLTNSDVRGYRITERGSVRAALEPLQARFPFDVAHSGYKLRFVSRGGTSLATIPETDLGTVAGSEKDAVLLTVAREMDTQLPRKVSVKYLDVDREYDMGEQYAERPAPNSVNERALDLPMVLNSSEGAQTADILLSKEWVERVDFGPFSLPPTWRHLEAADVVTVEHRGQSYTVRLTRAEYLPDGRITCNAKLTASQSYTSTATGEAPAVLGQSLVPLHGSTSAYLLDIPRLRSEQDVPGMAFGMLGQASGWPGGVLLRSDDSGSTWTSIGAMNANARVFSVAETLAEHHGYSIDHGELTVTPLTPSGGLFSVTEEQFYNEANLAAYGADGQWEIVSFKTSVDNGTTFTLKDFLRGLYGTTWATGLHAAGDALVMLDTSTIGFFGLPTNALNAPRSYRSVTQGASLDSAPTVVHTCEANNLKPLAPVDLNGDRNPTTKDWTLSWQRRTRWPVDGFSGATVPLAETSESYEVEIYSSGTFATLVLTLSGLSTPAASYSSAQQIADFGSNQTTLYLKIYQLSSAVGRGLPLQTSIYRFVSADPFGDWVKLLMHMNDTNLTDYKLHSVTKNGNAQRVIEAAMFDGYAADFDGTGDYLTTPYVPADFDWWTESYTLEFFIIVDDLATVSYLDGAQKSAVIGNADPASGVNYWSFGPINDGTLRFAYYNGAAQSLSSTATITAGVRSHMAFCSDSSGIRIYLDGNRVANGTNAGGNQSSVSYPLTIGQINNRSINGRIDEVRITKGGPTARYTGTTYTVPTTAFPDP